MSSMKDSSSRSILGRGIRQFCDQQRKHLVRRVAEELATQERKMMDLEVKKRIEELEQKGISESKRVQKDAEARNKAKAAASEESVPVEDEVMSPKYNKFRSSEKLKRSEEGRKVSEERLRKSLADIKILDGQKAVKERQEKKKAKEERNRMGNLNFREFINAKKEKETSIAEKVLSLEPWEHLLYQVTEYKVFKDSYKGMQIKEEEKKKLNTEIKDLVAHLVKLKCRVTELMAKDNVECIPYEDVLRLIVEELEDRPDDMQPKSGESGASGDTSVQSPSTITDGQQVSGDVTNVLSGAGGSQGGGDVTNMLSGAGGSQVSGDIISGNSGHTDPLPVPASIPPRSKIDDIQAAVQRLITERPIQDTRRAIVVASLGEAGSEELVVELCANKALFIELMATLGRDLWSREGSG